MDDVHLRGVPGEEGSLLDGRVPPAHHGDLLILEERPVANGALGNPFSLVFGLPRDAQALRRTAGERYNNRMSMQPDVLIIGGGVIGLTTAYFLAREETRVEVVDLFHFLISLAQVLGMSADDVFNAYCKKNEVNFQRQESGYAVKDHEDSKHI